MPSALPARFAPDGSPSPSLGLLLRRGALGIAAASAAGQASLATAAGAPGVAAPGPASVATPKRPGALAQTPGAKTGVQEGRPEEGGSRPLEGPLELIGLDPAAGPLDGGTVVSLDALGLEASEAYNVSLSSVSREGKVRRYPKQLRVQTEGQEGAPFFVMPNLSLHSPSARGALVSLRLARHRKSQQPPPAGPLLFRLFEARERLAPARVQPCCEFKISGGEPMLISCGSASSSPPARRALVRFRGVGHQEEAEGEVRLGSGGPYDEVEESSLPGWHLRVEAPAWPRAEGHISLEVSWDMQQFSAYWAPLRFMEEESFFGAVAAGVSEAHLARGASFGEEDPASAPGGGAASAARGEIAAAEEDEGDAEVISVAIMDEDGDHAGPLRRGADSSHVTLVEKSGDSFVLSRGSDLSVMQEDIRLIHDLFLLTIAATVSGVAGSWLRVPGIIAFIVGGAVVGPGGIDGVNELVQVESVAQLGVVLLLFCLGLEFSWAELVANTRAAAAGLLSIAVLCGFTVFFAAFCMQTPVHEALCIGLFASLSSTPMSLKAVPSHKASGGATTETSVLLAVLVTQDMVLAGLLAILPGVFRAMLPGKGSADVPAAAVSKSAVDDDEVPEPGLADPTHTSHAMAMVIVGQAAALVLSCLARRRITIRFGLLSARLREWTLRPDLVRADSEFFTLAVLSYAFALSDVTHRLGLSVELGAFVAGLSIASLSPDLAHIAHERLGSLREALAALFFASIGLVVNAHFLLDNLPAILSVVGFIFVLKAFSCFLPLWLLAARGFKEPKATALRLSCILAHVGEFGFVLAAKGASWGALSRHVYLLLVGTNAVSLCLAPWCFQLLEWSLPREVPKMAVRRASGGPSSSGSPTTKH